MSVTIRRATKEDVCSLLSLMYQYIVDFYQCPPPKEENIIHIIHTLLDNPYEGIQWVAEGQEGTLIGFATMYFSFNTLEAKRMAILHDLFVTPESQGQQIGEKLLDNCIKYIRENNYSHMVWETAHDNVKAQKLYDKIGAGKALWLNYEIK